MSEGTRGRIRAAIAALILVACFLALGFAANHNALSFDRVYEGRIFGTLPNLADRLSDLGRLEALLRFAFACLAIAAISAAWRKRALFAVGCLIVAHFCSDFAKDYFARPRPDKFLFVHETSYAYPSGHAATATAFFFMWAYFFYRSPELSTRPRGLLGGVFALLGLGICWSRLALGAHWPTDIIGGVLLGSAVICTGYALIGDPAPPLEDEPEEIEEIEDSPYVT